MNDEKFGVEILRDAVRMLGYCNETFNMRFSPVELLKLCNSVARCKYDVFPDQLTAAEVKLALRENIAALNESLSKRL